MPKLLAKLIENTAVLLEIDYADKFYAGLNFFFELNIETSQSFIYQYQIYMQNVIKKMKTVCCCCRLFILVKKSSILYIQNQLMSQSLRSGLLVFSDLDSCNNVNKVFQFYHQYFLSLQYQKLPKYSSYNNLFWVNCQSYLAVFSYFFIAEEAIFACAHPVTFILKFRPNSDLNSAAYHAIKRHVVLLP